MKIIIHSVYALLLMSIFVIPDVVFLFMEEGYIVFSNDIIKELLGIFIISILILSINKPIIKYLFLIFFTFLSFIELTHFAFFHGPLIHYEITFFFTQFSEVKESVMGVVQYMLFPLLLWIMQLTMGYYLINKSLKNTIQFKYVDIFLLVLLLIVPISAYKRHNISSMMPSNQSLSIKNMINTFSLFLGKEVPKYFLSDRKTKVFNAYELKKNDVNIPQNIIVVMGESLGYKYMHLFGGEKNNTPFLDDLKDDKNFIYRKAYACGVDTMTAVPSFCLLKREPENIALLGKTSTNLFTLAKKQGYKVHYVTTQKLNILTSYSGDIDFIQGFKGKDELVIDYLEKVDFSQKNFIVLHQRNSHSPYEDFTPQNFYKYPFEDKDFRTYMSNTYANSILYTDYLLNKIVSKIKALPNSVMFMTSDHAEMMGKPEENGRYGHAFLSKEVAKVPALIYTNKIDKSLQKSYNNIECVNHYGLGKLVVETLGFDVNNPNENGYHYIQGTSIDGTNGFITYSNEECSKLD